MEDRLHGFQQEGKDLDRRGGLLAAAAAVGEDFSVPVHPEADEVGDISNYLDAWKCIEAATRLMPENPTMASESYAKLEPAPARCKAKAPATLKLPAACCRELRSLGT